ncbi:hypothetical protein [Duganella sp. Root1480D1]|uniref:hypothetical protein n=1 Tax=Duganella sp. Root1480D1 TaxID=1736471 RepID=UPI0007111EE2|nr:hypothetical protein [Duganella sp. Root1480D1]KQZ30269.1 hypothetical protein ASD58_09580 [Duganella sp. Root1480D1]
MNELVPSDLEAESTATVDGFTYTVTVFHDESGYWAHLSWQDRKAEQATPPFSNARAAMIEGHSLAEEYILAWRS